MDKIGVKIGLNSLPRAVVILCEISRQACKSCEICGIRVRHSHRFNKKIIWGNLCEFVADYLEYGLHGLYGYVGLLNLV